MDKYNSLIKEAIDSGRYFVDDEGKVFKRMKYSTKEMCQGLHKATGRYRVRIDGVKVFTHRVVGYAKFGDKAFEEGLEIDHIDENPRNNGPENLRLMERGFHLRKLHAGEHNKQAKLNWKKVNKIRKMYNEGFSNKTALARMFGVSDFTISEVVNGLRWREYNETVK